MVSEGWLIFYRDEEKLNALKMNVIRKYQNTGYPRKVQNAYLKERVDR